MRGSTVMPFASLAGFFSLRQYGVTERAFSRALNIHFPLIGFRVWVEWILDRPIAEQSVLLSDLVQTHLCI